MNHKKPKVKSFANQNLRTLSSLLIQLTFAYSMVAAEANADESSVKSNKKYSIPSGPLDNALNQFARSSGVYLSYPPEIAQGKETKGLNGSFNTKDGFKELLKGTGLEIVNDQRGGYYLDKASPSIIKDSTPDLGAKHSENDKTIELDEIQVRAKRFYEIGPLPGLGLTKEQIPGNVQSITAQEIKDSHSLSITDLMNKKLQSVTVNDYQGNPFQMDVQYRGFTAGPQIGTPQGLSVFFDGIRVNEPFGDVVNWDMIPMNALAGVDVFPGSNPIFGLNTLGGAFTLKTKDGFNNAGVDADVLTGSFGRKQLQAEGGWNNGTIGLFAAGNFFLEDGWRENSPSKVNQLFTKASYRGDKLDLNLSTLWVGTDLVGNGLLPNQMYQQDRNASFTSEDTTKNRLSQFQLSGNYFVNDNFTVTGQVYRRNSNRHSLGADAYVDGFPDNETNEVKRNLNPGEVVACQFLSTNKYQLPDYYVIDLADPFDYASNPFMADYFANSGNPGYDMNDSLALLPPTAFNGTLDDEYAKQARNGFDYWKNFIDTFLYREQSAPTPVDLGPVTSYSNGEYSYSTLGLNYDVLRGNTFDLFPDFEVNMNYFYTPDGVKHVVLTKSPINKDVCQGASYNVNVLNENGLPVSPDGHGINAPGVVEGTPVSVLSDNNIKQKTDGASLQLNWNLEHHKFMVGVSIDAASASYSNSQRLGLFDDNRKAYLSPEGIRDQYGAADIGIANNNFEGTSTTKSIYASETWSPIDTLNITGSARYNDTHVKNTVASRTVFGSYYVLSGYQQRPDFFNLCLGSVANCPTTGYRISDGSQLLKPAETEKFSFYSFNPSLGATWQAKENLNIYSNWSQGTRTPSVIELGCAFDHRPSGSKTWGGDKNGNLIPDPEEMVDIPKSLLENRECSLPTTLSGDPYLPQIKATTYDIGLRGTIGDSVRWNLSAYQTDLKDDIYFVALGNGTGFFDTVGKTRRRGLEAGLSGKINKLSFGVNYSLTDATFQDSFKMISENNSSSVPDSALFAVGDLEAFRSITVKPGDRMPGIPLHNLNASVAYDMTDLWNIGFSAVLHSESFIRGNENNEHRAGVTEVYTNASGQVISRQPFSNPGKVDGYGVVNFQTSYKFNSEWSATMLVNNVFDKEYFSAGRLGRNPFSPSINGAIGPGGYNHNSDDWLSANFLAPGAPRGVWFSLNWRFDPNKK
ncbi:TonB-dependent receptor domain-containing protein [Methylotenera sp. 1P/1]|uniref:TonB-dependent receptor domain-containing protein n=1 Tax=Methylotenera sp. 1P/1 TaxID=1131551 RepID=UPI000360627C